MNGFDAVTHAMTTISTGGYANYDDSFGVFEGEAVPIIAVLGMILGSLPFVAYLKAIKVSPRTLLADTQIRGFIITILFSPRLLY